MSQKTALVHLNDACLSKLDDLEAIVWSITDEAQLRFMLNRLQSLIDSYDSLRQGI
jgi:hypothetical protein